MCTVISMWLAGIPVADKAVLRPAASLHQAELVDTAAGSPGRAAIGRGSGRGRRNTARRYLTVGSRLRERG